MNSIIHQEQVLAKIVDCSQARLTGLSEQERAKAAYLRACEICGMIEVLKALGGYSEMVPHLLKHQHQL